MLYKGNSKIQDTGSYGVYHGSDPIRVIYHGSEKVYLYHRTFTWQAGTTFAEYTVPNYVSKIKVDCVASKGNDGNRTGGAGGRVQCVLDVTPNQTFYITVGDVPSSQSPSYNAADIRTDNTGITDTTSLQSRLIVAGGGGNGSTVSDTPAVGGAGGGLTGGQGGNGNLCTGGGGGTQSAGGSRGGTSAGYPIYGNSGTFGLGGSGYNGGTGGAGWYGGGGGSGGGTYYTFVCSGGGGGSSYTDETLCSDVVHTQGYQDGAGYITIEEIA